jgi:hypothetical protein
MPIAINVIWQSYRPETPNRHFWDTAMLEDLFSKNLWDPIGGHEFIHRDGFKDTPSDVSGAIVIVPGRFMAPHIDQLNHDLSMLAWCVVVIVGDEESVFPSHLIKHPFMRLWVQTPIPGKHDFANRFFLVGYPTDCRKMISEVASFNRENKYDWFFSGQVTHPRRWECVEQLNKIPNGFLEQTAGFTQGMEREKFYKVLCSSKIAPCPSGPQTPDTFRLAEALEAGCVPIADGLAPRFPPGYWEYVFKERPPFLITNDWKDLPAIMAGAVADWPANANRISAWWQAYKRRMAYDMEQDLNDLIGKQEPLATHDQISIVIPTSPIPCHPDTSMIEEVIGTIRFHFPHAEIFLMMDGVRPQMAHRRAQYEEYKRRLIWKCAHDWKNILPVVFETNSQQAIMMRKTLEQVKTPLVMFVEHDAPIVTEKFIDWKAIAEVLQSGQANIVRLYYFEQILKGHMYLMLDTFEHGGSKFVKTIQYSQWPNVGTVEFYKRILKDHFAPDQKAMIETVMYSPVVENPWENFKTVIYYPDGNAQRFIHRNGRAGDPGEW